MLKVIITDHALFEAMRRGIAEESIKSVVNSPQQKLPSKKGRVILQNKYLDKGNNKEMLLRIIGTETAEEFTVITVYKTSRISKYWREGGWYESDF
jgi:hypothetical protein